MLEPVNSSKRKLKAMSFAEQKIQIKLWSLRTAATTERTSLSASVTLEAALILPLFFFMMLNLLTVISAVRVQSALEAAVIEAGRKTAVYAFDISFAAAQTDAVTGMNTAQAAEDLSAAAGIGYAAELVRTYMQEHCSDLSCVKGGLNGIDFVRSDFFETDGTIDLVAHYEIKPMFGVMSFMSFSMEARYFGHAWTGYQGKSAAEDEADETEDEIVYVTPRGSVYHKTPNCTYLKPSVRQVSPGSIDNLRNRDGGKYYPCENCGSPGSAGCYVTDYGDRYHSDPNCKKIYHDIIAVRLSEVAGKGCCSKCK